LGAYRTRDLTLHEELTADLGTRREREEKAEGVVRNTAL
jgi:hypothetical protein